MKQNRCHSLPTLFHRNVVCLSPGRQIVCHFQDLGNDIYAVIRVIFFFGPMIVHGRINQAFALLLMVLGVPVLAAGGEEPPAGLAPQVDYHQHLLSPDMAKKWSQSPLPAVQLPEDLNTLLAARDSAFGNKEALEKLYTEDSVLFDPTGPAWIRGRMEVASYLAGVFARPYKITPVAYAVDGASGYIAGYLSRGEGAEKKHFAHFHTSLRKGKDGKWQIAAESLAFSGPVLLEPIAAEDLIELLDEAGIKRAVVLSVAYAYADPDEKPVEDEYGKVRAENDWTAQQVSRFPDRLVGFCGLNPLKDYALQELTRCTKELKLSGLKLHFGNSSVDVRDPAHLEKIRGIFRAANEHRMPIVAHIYRGEEWYGRRTSEIFLNQILPEAPDIVVQVAHMAGAGPGYNSDEAFAVFAEALSAEDPRTKNLYFDVTTVVTTERTNPETGKLLVKRMRQAGLQRILYGSDMAIYGNAPPQVGWAMFRSLLPLTDAEFKTIAANVAPYLR